MQAEDGTFIEEPGSGAMAVIDEKKVSVGTLDWVRRYSFFALSLPFFLFAMKILCSCKFSDVGALS